MLLGLTVLFAVSLLSATSYRMALLGSLSNEIGYYNNVQRLEAFENIIESTQVQQNSTLYNDWINSLYVSARADGINVSVSNSLITISTKSRPRVYAVMRVG
jgi:hypothetical protein